MFIIGRHWDPSFLPETNLRSQGSCYVMFADAIHSENTMFKKNLRLVRKRNEPCSTDSAVPVKRKVQVISFTWHRHHNSKYSKKRIVRKFKGFISVLLKRSRSLNLGYVYSIPDSFCAGPKTIPEGLLFTHTNSDFGSIAITERSRAAPIFEVKSHISNRYSHHTR